jgi:integrase
LLASSDAKVNNNNAIISSEFLERKIASATDGLVDYFTTQLNNLSLKSKENTLTICDYIAALTIEVNPVVMYKRTQILVLYYLSLHCYDHTSGKQKKLFSEMTRNDVLGYLDSIRKPEASPMHKWIGTFNLRRIHLIRFFKWLYYPSILPSKNRPIPDVVKDIPKLKRKERSTIKPTDLWTEEEDYLFLKYCPSSRDRCYHTVSRDTSCRPSEILGLRIRDIVFKIASDESKKQYAVIMVNGKTGNRNLPLFISISYVKDWITTHHPQKSNPNAFFIPSLDR